MSFPKLLLHAEGLVIAAASTTIYLLRHESGWLFFFLILAPDLGMLGYLINKRIGSICYNLLHTYVWPITFGFIGVILGHQNFVAVALIWVAHIGADRLLGFGLKYPTGFQDTDLQKV